MMLMLTKTMPMLTKMMGEVTKMMLMLTKTMPMLTKMMEEHQHQQSRSPIIFVRYALHNLNAETS